jgi:flagellar basal-body rod modification protein FlgD
MSVAAIEGSTGPYGTLPASSAAAASTVKNGLGSTTTTTSSTDDKDMFLKLLVAQMKYQDPMNPTDSADFLSQSAQFTSLEKMQKVSDQTGMLLGASMAFGASSLVGRTVSYTLDDGSQGTGQVSGVTFGDSGPVLQVGADVVPIANVVTVTDGTTPPAAAPSTAS